MSIAGRMHPKIGMILKCDFNGLVPPEMGKHRPVIVVGEEKPGRAGTVIVVPISTRRPDPICDFHYQLPQASVPTCLDQSLEQWAKCDMITTVSLRRLDRYWLRRSPQGKRIYGTPTISAEDLEAIRRAMRFALDMPL